MSTFLAGIRHSNLHSLDWRFFSRLAVVLILLGLVGGPAIPPAPAQAGPTLHTGLSSSSGSKFYQNPLTIRIPGDGLVESCADPTIFRSQTPGDGAWYIFCTTDPLNDSDHDAGGSWNFHLIPMLASTDLVNWTYVGDVFAARPSWVATTAGLWAPEVEYFNGQYYLYYTASETSLPGGGSAIGVATSASPTGPWIDSGEPVVEPHEAPCCPGSRRWVFDPALIQDETGQRWIYYGSYYGGISMRRLSADGLHSDPSSQRQVTIANRYEGAFVFVHNGFYYLFGSATNCCNGPLTGYSVFVGRSTSPTGPFVDREGISLLAGRVGGTPVLSMNGNRWVGPGHMGIFTDFSGQDWMVYHAIDQNEPYFEGDPGFTRRPVLMDPLDWVDGWPTVRGGFWASDFPQPAPAAQPDLPGRYNPRLAPVVQPGDLLASSSDEFNGASLGAQWHWIRSPDPNIYGLDNGIFRFLTQDADLYVDSNNASVLAEPAPTGNYIVEIRVSVDLPAEGCCYNYRQAGVVIYSTDDNFIKLADVSIWETRQTEFAKEVFPVPAGFPQYGNTVVGPPGEWVYLRILKRNSGSDELYTAFTSLDGVNWVRGGVWTHRLGSQAQIGLVSMGGSGSTAYFDYVRVYRLPGD